MSARDLLTRPFAHDDSVVACKFLNCTYPRDSSSPSINQAIDEAVDELKNQTNDDQSNDLYMLVTAGLDGTIKIWLVDPVAPTLKSPLHVIKPSMNQFTKQSVASLPCTSIAVSPIVHILEANQSNNQSNNQPVNQSIFFTSHMDGLIQAFDGMTGERVLDWKADVGDATHIEAINQTNNNQFMLTCGSINGHVTTYTIPSSINQSTSQSITQSKQIWQTSFSSNQSNNHSISCMSSNGRYLMIGSTTGDICLIDCSINQSNQICRIFSPPVSAIRSLSSTLSNNQSNQSIRIYAGCSDGTVRVYQVNDLSNNQSAKQSNNQSNGQTINQTVNQLSLHSGWITSCLALKIPQFALNNQSINLLTTSVDQSIKLTDEKGENLHTYQTNNQSTNQSIWCADLKTSMLAVGLDDGSLRLCQVPIV